LLGGYPRNACAIPNGIDTLRFRPANPSERQAARDALGLAGDQPVILFVGRLVERKGIDLVLEVSRHFPHVRFLIVGDGPLAETIPDAANVHWLRSVAPGRIHTVYHASDAFLLPSHGEGLPLAVQEAAACGLPMIVSEGELYAAPLIGNGVCLAAPRIAGVLADRVREVLAGKPIGVGARAHRYASEHWSVGVMAARYQALLQEVHGERRKGHQS
jgi:glycosyltransferase involved in cell wall biosynthesis